MHSQGKWSDSCLGHFINKKKPMVPTEQRDPRVSLEVLEKKKEAPSLSKD